MKKRKMRHGPGGCPRQDCSGGTAGKQNDLTQQQLDLLASQGVPGATAGHLRRCLYCGAVYLRNDPPEVLGFLNSGVLGEGWHPLSRDD